uniref:VIgL family C1q-related protein 5 n=1 Tax=Littorina littorea TaxID=31216 RepID=A0A411DEM1_LITLI|nr:VIgL family C1q-related protein 5 [Littorina littorea]
MRTPLHQLLLLLLVASECSCIQWSSSALKEDSAVYACDNSDLILSWDVSKTTGETIVDVQWYYEGRSQELIAMLAHGHLNVMPAFSGRVELTGNAGLVIHHVTAGEKGNYSVEVNAVDASGRSVTLRRKAAVLIGDGLMTTNGQLHVSQMAVAVFSNSTQQWHVALTCGTFTYPDSPPSTVEWTTPSGQSVSSSQYQEGQFLLLLDNPVSGGSYTCHVPQRSASAACLHGNSTDVRSTVVVDDVKARLTLLEAENRQLKEHLIVVMDLANVKINLAMVNNVSGEVIGLKAENEQLKERLAQQERVVHQTQATMNSVSGQLVQHLQDESTQRVSFRVSHLNNTTPTHDEVLIYTWVHNNHGNGYNSSTGKFTAPFTGIYCFLSTLCGIGSGSGGGIAVHLVVDGAAELYARTDFGSEWGYDMGTHQAAVHVRAGQSVWLLTSGGSNVFDSSTACNSFSGFLIYYGL